MPSLEEVVGAPGGPLHDALLAGLADISQQQPVTFTTYSRYVLPLDGFVFWLRRGTFQATGALHYSTERYQAEDETATRNSVVFTSGTEIVDLNTPNSTTLIVGEIDGMKYAFTRQGWFFPPAAVWHYTGEALQPSEATQLVDNPGRLDPTQLIVSNSLPAWLSLFNYRPIWLTPLNPAIPLFPSYLVPDNIEPPYGSVHIEPTSTVALQSAPWLDRDSSHYQLTAEDVRITLYGCSNNQALDFLDLINRYSYDYNVIGIMNMPTVRDGKRAAPEAMILAQQKFIDVRVSYVQTRINNLARQMILEAQAVVLGPDLLIPQSSIYVLSSLFADADIIHSNIKLLNAEIDASALLSVAPNYARAAQPVSTFSANLGATANLRQAMRPGVAGSSGIAAFASRITGSPAQIALQAGYSVQANVILSGSTAASAAFRAGTTAGLMLDSTSILMSPEATAFSVSVPEQPVTGQIAATAGVQVSASSVAMVSETLPAQMAVSTQGGVVFSPILTIAASDFVVGAPNLDATFSLNIGVGVTGTFNALAGLIYFAAPSITATMKPGLVAILGTQATMPASTQLSLVPAAIAKTLATVPLASSVSAQAMVLGDVGMPIAPATSVSTSGFAIRPMSLTTNASVGFSVTLPSVILSPHFTIPAAVSTAESGRLVGDVGMTLPVGVTILANATIPGQASGLTSAITPSAATHYHTAGPFDETEGSGSNVGTFTDSEP